MLQVCRVFDCHIASLVVELHASLSYCLTEEEEVEKELQEKLRSVAALRDKIQLLERLKGEINNKLEETKQESTSVTSEIDKCVSCLQQIADLQSIS